ncbi:MAG: hypothetical protein ACPL7K_09880, partial [Armatimonadota bacterium]
VAFQELYAAGMAILIHPTRAQCPRFTRRNTISRVTGEGGGDTLSPEGGQHVGATCVRGNIPRVLESKRVNR